MATKPVVTVPLWASNTNQAGGPYPGTAAKWDSTPFAADGHYEGNSYPTDNRTQNDWQNKTSQWIKNWVEQGSSLGAADAHIVECDANGKSAVRRLEVLGNAAVAGNSLTVTRGQAGSYAAEVTTTGISTILFGGDGYAMQLTSNAGGVAIGATGDTIPLTLFPQATRPTTFAGNDGGIYIEKVAISGDDAFALRVVANGQRMSVPLYRDQHVHAFEHDGGSDTPFSTGAGSDVSIIQSPMIFYQGVAPLDANVPMIYDISFEAQVVGFAATTIGIIFKNNATTINTFQIQINNTGGFQPVFLRGIYASGASSLAGNSFDVRAYKITDVGGANVVIRNAITTIRGAR
jgi:hypothetical protein